MQKIFSIFIFFITAKSFAQIPEDAIRYSWFQQNGTARTLAIGGAIGSLGGDITATFVNPAGIGFYRTNEASITPGYLLNKIKTDYRGTQLTENKNAFQFGATGFAWALPNTNNDNRSNAFSIAFTQNVSFNNTIHYKGLNNYSSFSEQFAEEFKKSNKSIDEILDRNSSAPYTTAPALYTYLVDTVTINGALVIKAAPEYILDAKQALQQEMIRTTKGGMYELGAAYSGNDGEKWLWGVAIGIPIVNYESNTLFKENDTSSNTTNHFKSFSYNDNFTTRGAGINGKFGIIFRPKEYIRLGLAVHTPTYMSLTDARQSSLETQLENPIGNFEVSSDIFTNGQRGKANYLQNGPWKAMLSGSYVFREVEDVTKQRGFVSADIEYVRHNGTKFSSDAEEPTQDEKTYYKQLNGVIKDIYKGNINVRVGGEVKFNTIMGRLGFGYYGNPYKDAPSKANKMTLSGGLGYRNKGFFVDLTYVHLLTRDFDIPYRLQNAETVYANVKQQTGNVMATIGVKF
jgi:hypothetical protein